MTDGPRASTYAGVSRRALPRVVGAAVGVALVGTGDAAAAVFGYVALGASVGTNPVRWWRYVVTGNRFETTPAQEFVEPGAWGVEIRDAGPRPINVIKVIREVTRTGFTQAREQVANAPVVIVAGLSKDSAGRVRDRIATAGAAAAVVVADPA